MFQRLGTQTGAILIIFIIFLGGLFLLSTVGRLWFYWWATRLKTSFSGQEIFDQLMEKNHFDHPLIRGQKLGMKSAYYTYHQKTKQFRFSNRVLDQENLFTNLFVCQSVVYAQEKTHQTRNLYYYQYWGLNLLNFLLYGLFLAMMLLTFLPGVDVNQKVALRYWISVEALAIIGWVFMLIIIFWWVNVTMKFNESVEAQVKGLGYQILTSQMTNYSNLCAYFPFSFRTVI